MGGRNFNVFDGSDCINGYYFVNNVNFYFEGIKF